MSPTRHGDNVVHVRRLVSPTSSFYVFTWHLLRATHVISITKRLRFVCSGAGGITGFGARGHKPRPRD